MGLIPRALKSLNPEFFMKVTLNWLNDYVDLTGLSAEKIAEALTMAGLEVEAVQPIGQELAALIVAEIREVEKHPEADRLSLCKVSTGREILEVVCGAPNVRPGVLIPLALPGTVLPGGMEVKKAVIRNRPSAGMLCSEKELGLSADHSGIMLLPEGLPLGQPLSRALGLEDCLLEINVTPNRADCLSLIGIAREVAALFDRPLRLPAPSAGPEGEAIRGETSVTILDPKYCPRYAARLMKEVTIGPSPFWLRQRLNSIGLRSINNVVDITNFVLMEYGQPLHAFDWETLEGRRIVVRRAEPGESLVTLDGVKRELSTEMLVIADGRKGVALAGIMGGQETEIQPRTRAILIESAFFEPRTIRKTAKRLSISTEASVRFERGVDMEGILPALHRAARLIQELAGGEVVGGWIDAYPEPQDNPTIYLDPVKTSRFLGLEVSAGKILEISRRLGFSAVLEGENRIKVNPPSFRRDLTRPIDLIEEMARLIGYDKIPATLPEMTSVVKKEPAPLLLRRRIKAIMAGRGFDEIITYSFISDKASSLFPTSRSEAEPSLVRISNPISEDQAVMRSSLVPGLLMTMARNWSQRNLNLRLFEIGKVFIPLISNSLPLEVTHFCALWAGRRFPEIHHYQGAGVDFYDLKGVVEELSEALRIQDVSFRAGDPPLYFRPDRYVRIFSDEEALGEMGEISVQAQTHFDLEEPAFLFDLNLDLLLPKIGQGVFFRPWPRFPEVTRDMALILDDQVLWRDIQEEVRSLKEVLIEDIELFDLYYGKPIPEGKKNLGVRIHYRSLEKTLSDEQVNAVHEKVLKQVIEKFGATLREK